MIIPITRKEQFLESAVAGEPLSAEAVTRIEKFLDKIAGGYGEIPTPVTRIEKYLAAIAGENVSVPEPITRKEMFLAKIAGMDVETPEPVTRIEMILDEWAGGTSGILKTVSGSIIFIADALARPAESLVVGIEPIQSLNGYDNPWPAGGGKNTLDISNATSRVQAYGLTGSVSDEVITISGTYTNTATSASFRLLDNVPNNGQSLKAFEISNGNNILMFRWDGSYNTLIVDLKNLTEGQTYDIKAHVVGYTGDAPTSWSPYSNICPISGHDSVKVTRTGKNLLDISKSRIAARGSFTEGNVTVTYNDDGTIRLQSSGSTRTDIVVFSAGTGYPLQLPNGTYTFSIRGNESVSNYVHICASGSGDDYNGAAYFDVISTSTTTVLDGTKPWNYLFLRIFTGGTFDCTISLQVEAGSTATAYEPYSGTSVEIALGQTVYGGTLDVTTGVLTVDRAYAVLNGTQDIAWVNWRPTETSVAWIYGLNVFGVKNVSANVLPNLLSNKLPTVTYNSIYSGTDSNSIGVHSNTYGVIVRVADTSLTTGTAINAYLSSHPIEICYELATPTTIQLTPTEIEMLEGNNTLWADSDEIELQYWAEENNA